jgi:hypothetical protein
MRGDNGHLTRQYLLEANGFQIEATAQADRRWLCGGQTRARHLIQINVAIVTGQGRQIATGAMVLNFSPIQKNISAVHGRFP